MVRRMWILPILLFCSSVANAAERLALVIGNDHYAHFQSLSQAGGDARRVGDVLETLPQPFTVTRVANVNRVQLIRALNVFQSQLSQHGGEVAFVYYAGHAVNHRNRVWLLPVDAEVETPADIEAVGVSLKDVAARLRVDGWKAVVLVLDACRNQLFADGKAPTGVRGDVLSRGLPPIPRVEGLLLAYATASGEVAKEDTATGGYYTRELLAHLRQPGLKLQDVFNNTALAVQRKTGQKPELNLTAIEPIFLAGQPTVEPIAGPDAERQLWDESHCNSSDRLGCEAYLAAYPQGRFAALARARMPGGRRVEQAETLEAGSQSVVQLSLPPPAPKERFERVAEGIRDHEQKLIWAERDNGSDIDWNDARRYCASGSGWELPSRAALQSMYDASGKYGVPITLRGRTFPVNPATSLIKFSGSWYWSGEADGASEAWYVYLRNGYQHSIAVGYAINGRALCVRRS